MSSADEVRASVSSLQHMPDPYKAARDADADRYRQALETIQWWEYEVDACDGLLREARDLLYHTPAHRPAEGSKGNCPGCDLERRIDEHLVEGHQTAGGSE